jgi:hypothetical protein
MVTRVTDSIAQVASGGKMRKLNVLLFLCFSLFFASTPHGQTGVNNGELNGNYAFDFTGISGNGSVSSVYGAVGRFTADGAGNVTNGEVDINTVGGGAVAQSFTGTYAIGSGTMEKADTTAYSAARITGDYVFGAAGFENFFLLSTEQITGPRLPQISRPRRRA